MAKPVFIYCLKCPRTGDVRYVGKTDNLRGRLSSHIKRSSKKNNPLGIWLRSLKGKKPVLAVLHEVAEHEFWAEEERRYISCARAIGIDLVNATDGGGGVPGRKLTPEQCAAISARQMGVPHSSERCAAISASKKGVPLGPLSPEWRAAMSAAKRGVPLSPERAVAARKQCAVMSAANRGVPWSPARRAVYERRRGAK